MLKRKLEAKAAAAADHSLPKAASLVDATISEKFAKPLWVRFYEMECALNAHLSQLEVPANIVCTYNPLEYASSIYCAYLRRYLTGTKKLMFIGMNPGPNGMGQTGVPFGNVGTVRDTMQLTGEVLQPPKLHPNRPIQGLSCKTEEPSGVRLWGLFQRLAGGSLDTFSQQCYVHNFCPLAFFDGAGHNITPSELKGDYKRLVRDLCLGTLEELLNLVQPEIVVAVGDYVFRAIGCSSYCKSKIILRLPHPSPRSVNNANWPEKAQSFLEQHDLIKYMRNEA